MTAMDSATSRRWQPFTLLHEKIVRRIFLLTAVLGTARECSLSAATHGAPDKERVSVAFLRCE
jgi:hypothetical protein